MTTTQELTWVEWKEKGNNAFRQSSFNISIECYTEAIKFCVDDQVQQSILYSNRAMAFMQTEQFDLAIRDAEKSLELDPRNTKSYFRLAKSYQALNKFAKAYFVFKKAFEVLDEKEHASLQPLMKSCTTELQKDYEKRTNQTEVFNQMGHVGTVITGSDRVRLENWKRFFSLKMKEYEIADFHVRSLVNQLKQKKSVEENLDENSQQELLKELSTSHLPDNRFNWREQARILDDLAFSDNDSVSIKLRKCFLLASCLLFERSSPLIAKHFIHKYFKLQVLETNESSRFIFDAYMSLLASLQETFTRGHVTSLLETVSDPDKKSSLKYATAAVKAFLIDSKNEQIEKLRVAEISQQLTNIVVYQQLDTIESVLSSLDDMHITVQHIESIMAILDVCLSATVSNSLQTWCISHAVRLWILLLQKKSGAIQQLQELMASNDSNSYVKKVLNSFNSKDLPLPSVCINPFITRALCTQNAILRTDLELYLATVRKGLLFAYKRDASFLEKEIVPFFYGIAYQNYYNAYAFNISDEERLQVQQLVPRLQELLLKTDRISTQSELHDLLIVVSMYDRLSVLLSSSEITALKKLLKASTLPYRCFKLLKAHTEVSANNGNLSPDSTLLQQFYSSVYNRTKDHILDQVNPIDPTYQVRYPTLIEYMFPSFWPKDFPADDGPKIKILFVTCGCTSTILESMLRTYYNVHITVFDLAVPRIDNLPENVSIVQDLASAGIFDAVHISNESVLTLGTQEMASLLDKHLREGGVLQVELTSAPLFELIKQTRLYLRQQYSRDIFEASEELQELPAVARNPTLVELQQIRQKLLSSKVFNFYSQVLDFYNSTAFTQLILHPQLKEQSERFTFQTMHDLVEHKLKLRVVGITDASIPRGVKSEYFKWNKSMGSNADKLKDWKKLDEFAKLPDYHHAFQSTIHVICEKPKLSSRAEHETKRDPLNLKKFLSQYTSK